VKKPVKWLNEKPFSRPFFRDKAGYASPPEIEGTPRFPLEDSICKHILVSRLYTGVVKRELARRLAAFPINVAYSSHKLNIFTKELSHG